MGLTATKSAKMTQDGAFLIDEILPGFAASVSNVELRIGDEVFRVDGKEIRGTADVKKLTIGPLGTKVLPLPQSQKIMERDYRLPRGEDYSGCSRFFLYSRA